MTKKRVLQDVSIESGYVYVVTDKDDKILFGVNPDGSFEAKKYLLNSIDSNALKSNSLDLDKFNDLTKKRVLQDVSIESGYIYVVTDKDDRILFGVKPDGTFEAKKINFILSDLSVTNSKLSQLLQSKTSVLSDYIICVGDSLTNGAGGNGVTYANTIQSLNPNYPVINLGVGGENVTTISARMGSVPAYIQDSFILPSDTSTVEVSSVTNPRIKNTLFDREVKLLLQSGGSQINPCYVQNIECTLSYNATSQIYFLKRNVAVTNPTTIIAKSILTFVNAKKYRNPRAAIYFMGQNAGYSGNDELIDMYKRLIDFYGSKNYIVIGLHTGTASSRASLETAMLNAFGDRYVNLRLYCVNYALGDANITPTQADTDAILVGSCPPSILSDAIHFNETGYTLLGNLFNKKINELGIIK